MHQSHWKFNPSINHTKQFPLYFSNHLTDTVAKTLTAFGSNQQERIVYMGPRHTSSSKLLRAYAVDSRSESEINDSETYGEQEIQKYAYEFTQKQKFYPVRASQYRLFLGVNPTAKKNQLWFDSNFECGNLDLAVSLGNNQYDLFLRVDSNTKGHTCWFFFKVSNYLDKRRTKFNIVNLSRGQLLYNYGMKVYTYYSSTKQWIQDGQNIQFYPSRRVKYINGAQFENRFQYYTLSFQYEFKIQDQFIYFSYCVPYSYSYLNFTLAEMEKKHFKIVDIDRSNLSTGGLSIPIVTITNKNSNLLSIQSQQQTKKEIILVIARLHPGQTQSSWILHGFMNYLCSPKAKQLRNKAVFKIIPMTNVDGVVAGNFRTSILGRDLNRSFNHPQLIIQIGFIRSVAAKFKPIMFLDFHGHSSNKNIFAYGPDYSIDNKFFLPSRVFAKLVSKSAKAFRYYASSFRLSAGKRSTGRAVMMKNHEVNYSFTIQTSAFAYGTKRQETLFDKYQYIQSGSLICMGLDKFVKIIFILPKRWELQKELELQRPDIKAKNSKKNCLQNVQYSLSVDDKKILEEIMNDEKQPHKFEKEVNAGEDSDFEENNDYSEKQLKRMLTNPSQTPTLFQNKRLEKKTNKKLLAVSIKQSRKNRSLGSQKSMKLSIGHKLTEPSDQQLFKNPKQRLILPRKLIDLTPQIEKNQSESLNMNIQSFPNSDNPNINKINIKLPKKIFSDDSCIILEDPVAKLKSLNQAGLDYFIRKSRGQYQPLSQAKRIKQKQQNQLKHQNKIKQKAQIVPYNLCAPALRQKKQGIVQIKYSVLPMLGRSGNMNKQQSHSLMTQILQYHQRSISKRVMRHANVAYD